MNSRETSLTSLTTFTPHAFTPFTVRVFWSFLCYAKKFVRFRGSGASIGCRAAPWGCTDCAPGTWRRTQLFLTPRPYRKIPLSTIKKPPRRYAGAAWRWAMHWEAHLTRHHPSRRLSMPQHRVLCWRYGTTTTSDGTTFIYWTGPAGLRVRQPFGAIRA